MRTLFGKIMYWTGLAGATGGIFYAVNTIWIFESGVSLLQTSGRYVSFDDMLVAVGISIALILLSVSASMAARSFLNKLADGKAMADNRHF